MIKSPLLNTFQLGQIDTFLIKNGWTCDSIIDGIVNGAAKLIDVISVNIRKLQTGVAQFYALVMVLGIVAAFFWIILSL